MIDGPRAKIRVTIHIDADLRERIRRYLEAPQVEASLSEFVCNAAEEYLKTRKGARAPLHLGDSEAIS